MTLKGPGVKTGGRRRRFYLIRLGFEGGEEKGPSLPTRKKRRRRPREISHRFPPLFLFDPGPFYVHLSAVQTSSSSSIFSFPARPSILAQCPYLERRRRRGRAYFLVSSLLHRCQIPALTSQTFYPLPLPPQGPPLTSPPPFLFKAAAASWGDGRDKKACLREDRPLCNLPYIENSLIFALN